MCVSHESVHPPPPMSVLAASISFTLSDLRVSPEFSSRENEMDGSLLGNSVRKSLWDSWLGSDPNDHAHSWAMVWFPPLACAPWKCRNRRKRLRGSTRFVQREGANRGAGGDGAKRSNRTVKCGGGGGGGWEGGEHACKVGEEE